MGEILKFKPRPARPVQSWKDRMIDDPPAYVILAAALFAAFMIWAIPAAIVLVLVRVARLFQ